MRQVSRRSSFQATVHLRAKKTKPKKALGQNFLVDRRMQEKIVDACQLKATDLVLEIGPGRGALTQILAGYAHNIIAVEKDPDLIADLKKQFQNSNVDIIQNDFLKYPLESLPDNLVLVGNLPYNMATPIIEKVIAHRHQVKMFYFTVQWEYAQRLCAKPDTKDYGSLSCFVQYHADVKKLFRIKNTLFYPVPKVQSCFLSMKFFKKSPWEDQNKKLLFTLIKNAFSQRRKTIQNSLKSLIDKELTRDICLKCKINPQLRAENLSINDFAKLAKALERSGVTFVDRGAR